MKIYLIPGQLSRDDIVAIAHEEGYDGRPHDVVHDIPVLHTGHKKVLFAEKGLVEVGDNEKKIEDPTPAEVRKAAKGMIEDDEDNKWTKAETRITMKKLNL